MTVTIRVGFVTDIDALMRQARRQRMASRRKVWFELSTAAVIILSGGLRDVIRLRMPRRLSECAEIS